MASDSDNEASLDLFTEPSDYYPPSPKPTSQTHTLLSGQILHLRLVGHNPLWGHHLWQAGRLVSTYLEKNSSLVKGKTVLELGAGAGLPSLVCAGLGAKTVVVTDYPDAELVQNLQLNIDRFYEHRGNEGEERKIIAEGHCWGNDASNLLSHLPASEQGFEVLILADLLFNHSEHGKLVETVKSTLKKTKEAKALVFFTPYRPWLFEKDMAFFELVSEEGFEVEKVLEEKMERVMFEEDRGDEELRRTVFGYVVRWKL
ncbi:probable NNT1 Putative nicotinamide N-methyltransferase, has a role in rDNA silencing and in lifespan determination [Phialocephala subalpina]|uniref:Protein N-terminal and lysine N-methyltransferase EFM7 n=1 Tax=Phialocephala subalpina TaxID=576137 RepID=A0A1L7X7F5_9HELO|nr:probable NNT1 Putative nicotinamide N-methyltransferase, has a role in rDNA silencing and in lifespan determination [Phialocephala subalpina]